ncbi:MAG: hypothetical protein JW953_22190 [Anaerolineae bacterium]|nr:hypothetical protein [Anaerolineae bacterium]
MNNIAKISLILLLTLTLSLLSFTPPPPTGPVHKRAKTQPRPALSGTTLLHATEHFLIHYTLNGADAISATDEDGNGLPDYVDAVAEALAFSWQHEVERLGWRPPLPDRGEGSDLRFDVYLQNQDDLYGYVETAGGHVGDNPNTFARENHAAYGYLSLDNDYHLDDLGEELSPLDAMRTTVAHELHHAIQAAYDDSDPYEWLYEASAVWIEDEVYPNIGDAKSYLLDFMDAPDLCPLSVGRDEYDVRWYGGWILLRYISEHYGGPPTIRQLWEHMATLDGLQALQATLAEQGTTLAETLVNFSIANLTKSNCPTNTPYCYAQGSDYLRPYVEGTVRVDPGEVDTFIPKDGVQQFGADYVRLKSKIPILVDFRGSPAGQWAAQLVGLAADQSTVIPLANPGPTAVDPTKFDRLYLVIVNITPVGAEEECGYYNYTLALADAAMGSPVNAPPVPDDPGPYLPPTYQDDSLSPLGGGTIIRPADAPFTPLYPGYLPAGYTFSHVISYTGADLGEYEPDYAPAGEPVIALEYAGAGPEAYVSITQSLAPDESVADWVKAQGYFANDIRLVNNKPVYLIEYSDETNLSSATFIHQNRFIVIDGTFDLIDMQQVVAGFLANNP